MDFFVIKSWPDAARIVDTLQSKNIIPKVYIISGTKAEVTIKENEIETAHDVCDGWRPKQ